MTIKMLWLEGGGAGGWSRMSLGDFFPTKSGWDLLNCVCMCEYDTTVPI